MDALTWIAENWESILAVVGGVLTVANLIAKLTPTQKDDNFVEKARKFFDKISDLFLPDVQQE